MLLPPPQNTGSKYAPQDLYKPTTGSVVDAYIDEATSGVGTLEADLQSFDLQKADRGKNKLSAETYKNSEYYRPGVQYYGAMTEESAKILAEYNDERQANQEIIAKASTGQTVLGFGAGIGAGVFEPKNLAFGVATGFALGPLLGSVAPATGRLRNIVNMRRANSGYAARAKVGAVDGLVSAAVMEPSNRYSAHTMQQDYTMADSFMNIAASTVLGSAINTAPKFIQDRFTGNKTKALDTTLREVDLATDQLARGQKIDVAAVEASTATGEIVVKLTGKELGEGIAPAERVQAARDYYNTHLRDSKATSKDIGEVRFTGAGWQKFKRGLPTDEIKTQLLPAVKSVIEAGEYLGRSPIDKKRSDNIIAFHYFEGKVQIGEDIYDAGVSVGEDNKGNLFYNVNKDPQALLAKKKLRSNRGKALGAEPDNNVAQVGEDINIDLQRAGPYTKSTARNITKKSLIDSVSPDNDTAIDTSGWRHVDEIEYADNPAAEQFDAFMEEVSYMKREGQLTEADEQAMLDALNGMNEKELSSAYDDVYACLTRG